jgi:biopolymer transport protein ExbB/TolQ
VGLWPVLLTGIYAMSKRKEKIANQETAEAVAAAVEQTNAEAKAEYAKEMEQVQKLKQKEIENAVKKALEEAAKPEAEDVSDTKPEEADKKPSEEDS